MIWYHRGIGLFFGIFGALLVVTLWISGQWAAVSWSRSWGADRTVYVGNWNSLLVLGTDRYPDPYSWPERYHQPAPSLTPRPFYGAFRLDRPWFSPLTPHKWLPGPRIRKVINEAITPPFETVSLMIPYWLILLCYPVPCYLIHLLLMRRQRRLRARTPDVLSAQPAG